MSKLNNSQSFFNFFLKSYKPEAPKFVCPFVIIFKRIIAFKLVIKPKVGAIIQPERTLWFYSGRSKPSVCSVSSIAPVLGLLTYLIATLLYSMTKVCNTFGSFGLHSFGKNLN